MDQHFAFRLPAPHRHEQGLQDKISGLSALHSPTDHTMGKQVNHDRQIREPFVGSDIGNILRRRSQTCGVRRLTSDRIRHHDIKLAIQPIVDSD